MNTEESNLIARCTAAAKKLYDLLKQALTTR